ncbi:hypothetical protein AAIB41_18090 [Brucella sp. BE17]|uniref:hypothetical protein n=1 Tax=Brucella sp. BE17 TaxID=3142977 RepID=UPI0031BA3D0D
MRRKFYLASCAFLRLVKKLCFLAVLYSAGYSGNTASAQSKTTIDVPLSSPAYKVANEAYAGFNRADYCTAIIKVREAIRQRPEVLRVHTLLVDALQRAGRSEEATTAASELARLQKNAPNQLEKPVVSDAESAGHSADQVYRALERNNFASAKKRAEEAVRLAADVKSYRYLLIHAQLQENDFAEAEIMSTEVLETNSGDPVALMFRSASRLKLGDVSQARACRCENGITRKPSQPERYG